jgi:hypothetical protein
LNIWPWTPTIFDGCYFGHCFFPMINITC